MSRAFPDLGVHDDVQSRPSFRRWREPLRVRPVVVAPHHIAPPRFLHISFEFHAQGRSPRSHEASIDFTRLKEKAASLAERNQLVHFHSSDPFKKFNWPPCCSTQGQLPTDAAGVGSWAEQSGRKLTSLLTRLLRISCSLAPSPGERGPDYETKRIVRNRVIPTCSPFSATFHQTRLSGASRRPNRSGQNRFSQWVPQPYFFSNAFRSCSVMATEMTLPPRSTAMVTGFSGRETDQIHKMAIAFDRRAVELEDHIERTKLGDCGGEPV